LYYTKNSANLSARLKNLKELMSDDLVKKALASDEDQAITKVVAKAKNTIASDDDEIERSNQLAETLISLQNSGLNRQKMQGCPMHIC